MSEVEIVLGFDARERWCPRARLWPAQRRERFLLRPDVDRPLSADVFVWPSIFADQQLDLLGLGDLRLGSAGLTAPAVRGAVQDLWSDLSALRAALPATADRPHDVIAVAAVAPWHFDVPPSRPDRPAPDWTSLGLDVVDGWLLSGLANCGYGDSGDLDAWHARWSHHLNEHHLFADPAAAARFAAATSLRVPEHAPFHVCRIWRLP